MLLGNRYRVEKTISGGMGIVYICLDTLQDNFPVALKTLRPEFTNQIPTIDRFLQEATIWVNLGDHPNIVRAYRVVTLPGAFPNNYFLYD